MGALKRAIFMLMVSLLIIAMVGAVNTKELPSDTKGKPLIGIAMCSLLTERWYKDQEALTEELGRLGADVIVQNANNQQELQNQQAELESKLEEKMERWVYLNELKEKIDAQ